MTGTYILAIFLFAPVWGKLSDRWGRRPVLLMGLTGFAASVALFALVESLPLLYLGRFLDGLFAAAIAPVAYALVGDHAPSKEWRAHRFALINIAGTLGFFVGPMLGGLVVGAFRELVAAAAERASSAPFLATSGLALVAALMIWGLVPRPVQRADVRIAAAEATSDRTVMLRLWAIAFVTAVAVGAFEVGLSLRGKQVLGMDASQIGMMFAECSLVMFVVQALVFSPLVKPACDALAHHAGLAILALGLFAVPFADDRHFTMIVAVALVAASAGILSPIVTYWVSLECWRDAGSRPRSGDCCGEPRTGTWLRRRRSAVRCRVPARRSFHCNRCSCAVGSRREPWTASTSSHDSVRCSRCVGGERSCVSALSPTLAGRRSSMAKSNVVLCAPVRTAIGTYGGSLKSIAAPDLGAAVIRAALERSKLDGIRCGLCRHGAGRAGGLQDESSAASHARGGNARRGAGHDREPRLRLRRPSDRFSRPGGDARSCLVLRGGRHGEHGPGAVSHEWRALGLPHGGCADLRQHAARRPERCLFGPAFRLAYRGSRHEVPDNA